MREIRAALRRAPARKAYYPGSDSRVAGACDAYPDAENIGGRVLVAGAQDRTYLLQNESFAPVLGVIELPGADFLTTAVRTANDDFVGTLGVNLIAHPRTIKHLGARFEAAHRRPALRLHRRQHLDRPRIPDGRRQLGSVSRAHPG